MANHESDIRRAIADGDATKIRDAHEKYVESMEDAGQRPKPLSYFKD